MLEEVPERRQPMLSPFRVYHHEVLVPHRLERLMRAMLKLRHSRKECWVVALQHASSTAKEAFEFCLLRYHGHLNGVVRSVSRALTTFVSIMSTTYTYVLSDRTSEANTLDDEVNYFLDWCQLLLLPGLPPVVEHLMGNIHRMRQSTGQKDKSSTYALEQPSTHSILFQG